MDADYTFAHQTKKLLAMVPMDLNALNGAQSKILRRAIVDAFLKPELDRLLSDGDRESIDTIAAAGSFESQVFEVVERSQRDGWTDWLVAEVIRERPNNSHVRRLRADLEKAASQPVEPAEDSAMPANANAADIPPAIVTPATATDDTPPVAQRGDEPSAPKGETPNPAGTKLGQRILAVAGVVAALGVLGGAVDGAINKWHFVSGILEWLAPTGPDCDNYGRLHPEEQVLCDTLQR